MDAAIELFSILFPLQNVIVQESTMESLLKTIRTGKGPQSRRNTFFINVMTAIVGSLCYIMMRRGKLANDRVVNSVQEMAYVCRDCH